MNAFPTMPGGAIDRIIAHCTVIGAAHTAELFRAVRHGEICLIAPEHRDTLVPMGNLKRAPRPVLVVIGDDDYAGTGPAGWACTPTLLRWARQAIVHGTGATIPSYRLAVEMAVGCRRGLLIETNSAFAPVWREALCTARQPVSTLTLVAPNNAHPVMPAQERMP